MDSYVSIKTSSKLKAEEEKGCYCTRLFVRVEAAVLGGELLCHRLCDVVDVAGHLPLGTYHQPQELAPLPVEAELGFEAIARVPAEAAVKLLGPVVVSNPCRSAADGR